MKTNDLVARFKHAVQTIPGTTLDTRFGRDVLSPDDFLTVLKAGIEKFKTEMAEYGIAINQVEGITFDRAGSGQGYPNFDNTDYKLYDVTVTIAPDNEYGARERTYTGIQIPFVLSKPFEAKEWTASPREDGAYSTAKRIMETIAARDQQKNVHEILNRRTL